MFQLSHDLDCEPALLRLDGSLTIYQVAEAHGALLQLLAAAPERTWQLDLAGLDELDSAGAQLLLALQRQLVQTGFEVTRAADQVLELLELLRLQALYPTVLPANR